MQSNNTINNWNINLINEKSFIQKYIIGTFIFKPDICPFCKKGMSGIKNHESDLNPIQWKCNNYKCCRNLPIRKGSIFQFNTKTPLSILYNIMKYSIVDNFNVSKLASKLEEIYNIESLNKKFIYSYIFILRKNKSSILRNLYSIERLASNNANSILCIDESLFTHTDGMQTWVFGIINTDTNEIC